MVSKYGNIYKFHNWIRQEIIKKSITKIKENKKETKMNILDLTYNFNLDTLLDFNITKIVGVNKSATKIKKAYIQLKELKNKNKKIPKIKLYNYDLTKYQDIQNVFQRLGGEKFDIIIIDDINRYFEKEILLAQLIKFISRVITLNGIFIGIHKNGNEINKLFMKDSKYKSELFTLESTLSMIDSIHRYGDKFKIQYTKKIINEFIVDEVELKRICKNYGFNNYNYKEFEDWWENYDKELTTDDKKYSFLHKTFTFQIKN